MLTSDRREFVRVLKELSSLSNFKILYVNLWLQLLGKYEFVDLKRNSVFVIVRNTGYFSIMYWMIGNKFKFIISIIDTTYSS